MQYPSDWIKIEPSQISHESSFNIIVGFYSEKESSSDAFSAALSIGIHNLSSIQNIKLDRYTDAHINFIREKASLHESNTNALKDSSNKNPEHSVVYVNSEGQKTLEVLTSKGDKAYHIMYIAYEARYSYYLPLVQKMIDSFEVIVDSTVDSDGFLSSSLSTKDYDKKEEEDASSLSDFNFAAAGDWGCTDDTRDTVNNIIDKSPELVLGLGDYSYEDTADCWLDIIQPIDNIMKIVIGNHEVEEESILAEYMNRFGLTSQYYSFDYQNVHFIALATESEYLDMSKDKAKQQLAFVTRDLEKASANPNIKWIIPFFHRMM